MPVAAKLSRRFYEVFGDEIANELVDWFNQVDTTYRTELRELNELNFSRFDAKLEQRTAELDANFERRLAELDANFEKRVAELRSELQAEISGLRTEMHDGFGTLRSELVKWMFLFWAGTALTVLGLLQL